MEPFEQNLDTGAPSVDALLTEFELSEHEISVLAAFGPSMEPRIEAFVDEFYRWLRQRPYFDRYFPNEDTVLRVRKLQVEYWRDFFSAKIDEDYLARRRYVGRVHARVDLPPEIYLAATNFSFCCVIDHIAQLRQSGSETRELILAFTKQLNFDTTVVVSTYAQLTREEITEQSRAIVELSTPVTTIWEGMLLLPIIGIVDSSRALDISSRTLETIAATRARCLIMDISGVAVVDTAVANHLIKITKAARLMGCETTISGLSPEIAKLIVELGIDVGDIKTTATLRDAIEFGFHTIGYQVNAVAGG